MSKPGRRKGWRKKDRKETASLSVKIEVEIREWLRTQNNQATTVELALIHYRKAFDNKK